jgi:hypothetical protein
MFVAVIRILLPPGRAGSKGCGEQISQDINFEDD